MPRRATSAKSARRGPHSPNKTPTKQAKFVDFTSRRSNAGSSSSPAKASSYHGDESSETEAATDVSTDVNEIEFEGPSAAAARQRRMVIRSPDVDEKSSDVEVIDLASTDEEEEPVVVQRVRKGKGKQVLDVSEESEEEEWPVKRLGKRKAVALSLTPLSAEEEEEERKPGRLVKRNTKAVEEEGSEEDILDGLDEDVVLDSRLRGTPRNSKLTQLRENLARLKRRKLGHDTPPVRSKSESSESGTDAEKEEQMIRPRGRRVFKPIPGAQPTLQDYFEHSENSDSDTRAKTDGKQQDSEAEDNGSDLDSWIEDDGGEANVPVLPEGYSMLGHQSLAHHFKVAMQMFVHLACIKPKQRWAFRVDEKNDQYFGLSLRALKRKLDGMRDSLVVSSAWTPEFKEALNSYPELTIFHLDFAVPGCGACRISSRKSTRRGVLSGDNYNRDTFKIIVKNEDSDDEDDEELPTSFDLGRFCQARVRCYHNFVHWEWQLFETIAAEIEVLRTAQLRNDPTGQDRPAPDDPDGIMAWLDRRGIVEQEWDRLEKLMEDARGLEYWKGNPDE